MSYGANTAISRVITRATQIANAARRYFALTVLAAAVSACNQSNHDTTPPSIINIVPVKISDTTKPVLNISNASLVMGVILPNNATPSSFVIAPKGRITATDNNGIATLSVRNVVGLSAEQVQLAADGTLSAINILPTQAIGRGFVVVRATDTSGNFTDSTVYFDISPNLSSTQATLGVGQSHTFNFAIMPNITSASVAMPNNVMGVSGQAYLAGNEVVITLNTNSSAVVGEFKPQVSLITADGKVYPLVLTVTPKVDATTEYSTRKVTVNGTTVTVENPSTYATDADGKTSVTVYLSKGSYRLALAPASGDAIFDLESMGVGPKDLSGSWTVEVEPTVPNGATGQNQIGKIQRSSVEIVYDPAPTIVPGSAFANLGDMTVSDELGGSEIVINAGGVIDPLGRPIIYSAIGLPVGLSIDANTGVISGIYDAG